MGGHVGHTPGPWHLCHHLKSIECDQACGCGYRGVIFGPDHDIAYAVCQLGHDPAPEGQEGTEPARYTREVELANARLIATAPELLEALEEVRRRMSVLLNENEEVLTTTVQKHVVAVLGITIAAIAKAKGEV